MFGCDIDKSIFSDKAFQSYSLGWKKISWIFLASLTNERFDEC